MNNVANNILNKNTRNVKDTKTYIDPIGQNVVLEVYEENPYRHMETLDNGLILGIESNKRYKSNESGEMEENQDAIICAKVIAVGPKCQQVQVGDDCFAVAFVLNPLPYKGKNYKIINESNIICRIVNEHD